MAPPSPGQRVQAGHERRVAPRFDLIAQVRLHQGNIDSVAELVNISMTGALFDLGTLRPPSWVAMSRILDIAIVHPEDLDAVHVRGRVVRVDRGRRTTFAVNFCPMNQATTDGLARLHQAALGQSQTVRRGPLPPAAPRVRKKPPPLPKTPRARKGPPPLPKN